MDLHYDHKQTIKSKVLATGTETELVSIDPDPSEMHPSISICHFVFTYFISTLHCRYI